MTSDETISLFLRLAGGEGTNKLGHGAVFAALGSGKFGLACKILKQVVMDDDASKKGTPKKRGCEVEDGDDKIEDDDDEEDLAAMLMGMSNRPFDPDKHLKKHFTVSKPVGSLEQRIRGRCGAFQRQNVASVVGGKERLIMVATSQIRRDTPSKESQFFQGKTALGIRWVNLMWIHLTMISN